MLKRNANVKLAPEKFQYNHDAFDLIFTFEDRVFEAVLEDLQSRPLRYNRVCHILNLNVKDNHEEAEKGASICVDFLKQVMQMDDWEHELSSVVAQFENVLSQKLLHVVMFV